MTEVKLFSGTFTNYLSTKISDYFGQELGDISIHRFSDGEMQPEINESVRGRYVFFIQSTAAPSDNLFELLLMIDTAKRASAGYITAVIPYFGYARQDRKDKPRVPISAKLIADLVEAAGADRLMTMDLHADQIQGFFNIPVDHLRSEAIFIPFIQNNFDIDNVMFTAPDAGGVKRVRTYAKYFEKEIAICDKYRAKANEVAGMTLIGNVEGKDVILIDDLIDTGNTLVKAADLLLEKGAKTVTAFCTHPVLSGNAYETIENSSLEKLYVCDTLPLQKDSSKIEVISTAKLFARAIRNTFEHKSISKLFVGGKIK